MFSIEDGADWTQVPDYQKNDPGAHQCDHVRDLTSNDADIIK